MHSLTVRALVAAILAAGLTGCAGFTLKDLTQGRPFTRLDAPWDPPGGWPLFESPDQVLVYPR